MLKPILAALGACLLAAAPALAGPMDGGWHHADLSLFRGVTLSNVQKDRLKQLMHSNESQMHAIGKQMQALHQQLSSALLAGAPESQLTPILQQQEALRDQMDSQRLAMALQARALLTTAQLAQAAAAHAKLAALHEQERAVIGSQHGD